MNAEDFYPDFAHSYDKIVKYLKAAGIFTMKLKCGTIIHHMPEDAQAFECWLQQHQIPNMRTSKR